MKQRLIETKVGQLQQIKEKQSQNESERELERMWYQMLLKEIEAQVSLF